MKSVHEYEEMTKEKRPQDPSLNGSDLTYSASEHGGDYPDDFPLVIHVEDKQGRTCKYVPITQNGKIVDSKGFTFS